MLPLHDLDKVTPRWAAVEGMVKRSWKISGLLGTHESPEESAIQGAERYDDLSSYAKWKT